MGTSSPSSHEQSNNEQSHAEHADEIERTETIEPVMNVGHIGSAVAADSSTTDKTEGNQNENDGAEWNFDDSLNDLFTENVADSTSIDESQQNVVANGHAHATVDNAIQNESHVVNESSIVNRQDHNRNSGSENEATIVNELERSGAIHDQNAIQNEIEQADDLETKHTLPTVCMDEVDELALGLLIDVNSEIESTSAEQPAADLLNSIVLKENETAVVKAGKIIVTKKISGDLEMMYTYGETPRVLPELYQTKLNDSISGNIPFKENVCENHGYIFRLKEIYSIYFNFSNSSTQIALTL